jgi:hypothetical protein
MFVKRNYMKDMEQQARYAYKKNCVAPMLKNSNFRLRPCIIFAIHNYVYFTQDNIY